jgi:hypothetical protein
MLTIKRIEKTGHEVVHEVKSVSFQPRMGDVAPTLQLEMPSGDISTMFDGGTFFVMNEAGRTIARYWIGEGCLPCHEEVQAA